MGFTPEKLWGEQIEDRGSQINIFGIRAAGTLRRKEQVVSDYTKRKRIKAILHGHIPEFSVRIGGSTSIDVTKPGIDKAYGIGKAGETSSTFR